MYRRNTRAKTIVGVGNAIIMIWWLNHEILFDGNIVYLGVVLGKISGCGCRRMDFVELCWKSNLFFYFRLSPLQAKMEPRYQPCRLARRSMSQACMREAKLAQIKRVSRVLDLVISTYTQIGFYPTRGTPSTKQLEFYLSIFSSI